MFDRMTLLKFETINLCSIKVIAYQTYESKQRLKGTFKNKIKLFMVNCQ